MEVEERLAALTRLDHKITSILSKGVQAIRAVSNGKQAHDSDKAKQEFKQALADYNQLIGVVNSELRSEVKRLHVASSSDVLPLNLPTMATDFGQDKENEIWKCIYKSLEELRERDKDQDMQL